METNKLIEEKIKELDDNFDMLISSNNLTMDKIEDIAINNIDAYKQIINNHIENLIFHKVDEKELISKKNKNGKNLDINLKTKEGKN